MRKITLGVKGLDFVSEAIRKLNETSIKTGLSRLDLSIGSTVTWVPDALHTADFSLQGFGPDLDYDDDLWLPFREGLLNYLGVSKANLVFTQTMPVKESQTAEWLRKSPPGVARFAVRYPDPSSLQATWERYSRIQAPVTEESIEMFTIEAFPFARLYVFTSFSEECQSADWLGESQMLELTRHTQALALDAFDGSGVAFWRSAMES